MRTAFQIATVDIMILYGSHHQDEISIVNIVEAPWMLTWGPLASEFEMYLYDEHDGNDLLISCDNCAYDMYDHVQILMCINKMNLI